MQGRDFLIHGLIPQGWAKAIEMLEGMSVLSVTIPEWATPVKGAVGLWMPALFLVSIGWWLTGGFGKFAQSILVEGSIYFVVSVVCEVGMLCTEWWG